MQRKGYMSIGAISGAMGGYNIFGIGAANQAQGAQKYDAKEAEIAKKLGMSVSDFQKLSEDEKSQKVQEYNKTHPCEPIEEKGKGLQGIFKKNEEDQASQIPAISQFHNDVNWANVKLQ